MAWDAKSRRDSRNGNSLLRLFKSKKELAAGDAFPKLDFASPSIPVTATDLPTAMDQDGINLSSTSEEGFSPPGAPLTVHVTIQYTDPVIRSRYSRSYTSSHTFEPTNRICNGLLRRIDHCSKELLTRKDSTALDQYKDGTDERKCMRFEITFRIVRRGVGEWAERTFRSYQKQPLTVGLTKDIQLAAHRIVGLFLRRHDKDFQWLDGSIVDHNPDAPETALPSSDVGLSLLCVPRSRFLESHQSFEFVPGYTIQLSFRSRNPRRATQVVKSMIKVESSQPAPLSLYMSEEIQWRGLQAINHGLEERKRELSTHIGICHAAGCSHSEDDALQIELSITNNLGIRHHVYREIRSNFALFRDPEARDCNDFLRSINKTLLEARDHSDAELSKLDDFEFNMVELKGRSWSVRNPMRFSQGPSASYGRRTIQAALDRVQTGIGDVLRGNNVAVHISAHKRGHLVLDKAIIAREKRGKPAEKFSSAEEQQTVFLARLKSRIERDMEMVFRDTCSIDDMPDDEDDFLGPRSPGPEAPHKETRSNSMQSMSPTISRQRWIYSSHDSPPGSPTKPAVQRAFSLGHRSVSSAASIISAKNLDEFRSIDMVSESGSRRSSLSAQDQPLGDRLFRDSPSPSPVSPAKPQRRFSLLPRNYSSHSTRVSNASTLICETPSLLEESPEINIVQSSSREEQTVKAELLDADKFPETDGLPANNQANSMTLNDVADSNNACEAAGMVPEQALGILESDPSPSQISHAEVMAQGEAAELGYFGPPGGQEEDGEDKTQKQCDNSDEQRLFPAVGESGEKMDYNRHQHSIMDAFQDAHEYATAGLALHGTSLAAAAPKVDGLKSPGIDEYSTAPSTPALSLGGDSSPRPSLLATPSSYLQGEETISGTKGEEDHIFEPESDEAEEALDSTDIMDHATGASGNQQSTEPRCNLGDEFGLGDSIEPATEQPAAEPETGRINSPAIDNESGGPDSEWPLSVTASDVTEGEPILQDQPATVPSGDTEPMAPEPTADDITCSSGGRDKWPNNENTANTEEEKEMSQQSFGHDKDETENFGAENVDVGDLDPPDIVSGGVRSDPAPVSDHPDANLPSDNAQGGTEEVQSPPANVGRDSGANPFLLLADEVEEGAANGPEHGKLGMPPASVGLDSDVNPFVLLVDQVPGPDESERGVTDGAEAQPESGTAIGSANKGDLEGPGWIQVGSVPPEAEGIVPEEEKETAGLEEPDPSPAELDETAPEQTTSDVHGSGTTPEQPFIAPTGSALVDLEAEILAAAAINNLIAGAEEMFPDRSAFAEPAASERDFLKSPEPEPVASEEDDSPQVDAAQSISDQGVPAPSPVEEKAAETLAASGSVAAAAGDPDSYPDDIGLSEVARLQARCLLGEDYDLGSSTGPEFSSVPPAAEKQNHEDEDNGKVGQTDGNVLPAVVVGVLDPNIGTDPEANVVFQVINDDEEDHQQQEQERQQERVSSRRASELGEDICGHEYSTGSNRVGYAAVCLTGPPELDGSSSEAAPEPGGSAFDEAEEQDEALAEGDRPDKPLADTDAQPPITDPGASLPSQVDQVPPVVMDVIKQVLTGQRSELSEPDEAARHVDEVSPATKAATDVSTGFSHPETESLEANPAIVTTITEDETPFKMEAEDRDMSQILPEMAQHPPAVVVDLIKEVLTGEPTSESVPGESEEMDIQAELDKLEREIELEEQLGTLDESEVIRAELDQLMREMEPPGRDALPEMSEPAPTVVMVLGGQQEGLEEEEIKGDGPAEMADPTAVLEPTGPEAQNGEEHLPRVIPVVPVAVPDISNQVRQRHAHVHVAPEAPVSADTDEAETKRHVSVKDFEEVPVPLSTRDLGSSFPEAAEATETPKPTLIPTSVEDSQEASSPSSRLFVPDFNNPGSDAGISPRDSVDTIRRSFDNTDEGSDLDDDEPYPPSRPQTAGYLGLGDAHRRFRVLGVLGGRGVGNGTDGEVTTGSGSRPGGNMRRYSLPLHYLLDSQQQQDYQHHAQDSSASSSSGGREGKAKEKSRSPRTTWAKLMGLEGGEKNGEEQKDHKHRHHHHHEKQVENQHEQERKREEEVKSLLTEESSAEQAIIYDDGPTVVPRIMMLLAGVVAVGKIIKGPSGNY